MNHKGKNNPFFGKKHTGDTRLKMSAERKKENNPNWKGGITRSGGRIFILIPEHPSSDINGKVARARLVVEKRLGRYLLPTEHVHHINGIKDDDRDENLQVMTNSEHAHLHSTGINNFMYGKTHTKATKDKISHSGKGRVPWNKTDTIRVIEYKQKLAEKHGGKNNPFFGKHHSKEAKKKMREANERRRAEQNL